LDPAVIECPYHFYRALHREAPVHKAEGTGFYIVSRYEDIMEVLRKPEIFSSDYWHLMDPGPEGAAILAKGYPRVNTMLTLDPPNHRRYRKLVDKGFSPARVNAMEGYIQRTIDELIDDFIGRGEFELVHDFGVPLPIFIIADQLGVPRSDMRTFKEWSDAIASQFARTATAEQERGNAGKILEFQGYFTTRCAEKRVASGDDILSILVTSKMEDPAAPGGERLLTPAELNSIIEQILVAGNETTTNTIAAAMLLLLQQPQLMKQLRGEPSRIKAFVEETLRLESPVQGHPRIVKQDTTLAGVELKAGDVLNLRFAAGNRDPRQFPDPEAIDLSRRNGSAHLAFSQGPHFCLGAALARKEIELALRTLMARLENIHLTPDKNDLQHIASFSHRGLKQLHLSFNPSAVSVAPAQVGH
jgi:cytochrome P450